MTIETLQNLLKHYGLSPNKTYGQHFLMDETILEDMIDVAAVSPKDTIVEIGPGIGNLTERLLERGASVLAIEKDEQFLPVLESLQKEHENFAYELTDALKFDFASNPLLANGYKVVANIPYYITGKIVQMFLGLHNKPQSLTLLMQKEVARNIVAKAGQLNLLAISVQLFGEAELVAVVPAHKFYPAPKVDSAVIHIQIFEQPKYQLADEKKFFRVLRACFTGKRKQIHNTLTNNLGLQKPEVLQILAEVGVAAEARPQQLTIADWISLVEKISLSK
ncbi:MAG TPA: 16S rRNA (adenine(1518)-N(6)/adenine(1519)-N(6))-dimethyltransferase RsmA [Candidatus Doudnabacteria bacterium]|mgnify:CR=1 FL=1|nr:16S rRNA (adenine(1518)-N(6)/adenine(1519)-N(6))-dimethyltransferase RsmA [Candidatus Doudnabacteria bacterium]